MKSQVFTLLFALYALVAMSFEGGCGNSSKMTEDAHSPKNKKEEADMQWLHDLLNRKGDGSYESEWQKVAQLEGKGLTQDAKKVVQAIYDRAKKENNAAENLKSLLYLYKYDSYTEENSQTKAVESIRAEIATAAMPSKALLQSVLADMYWQYFQAQQYTILQRTAGGDAASTDFLTWDATRFSSEITRLHLSALEQKKALQQVPLNSFDPVLQYSGSSRQMRPTLYDFLAHRALDYFMNDQADITKAADQFQITQAEAFADTKTFVAAQFTTTDSLSLKYYALQLLQELAAFHQNDANPAALVDVEIKRLQYAKLKGTAPDKKERYLKALEQMAQQHAKSPECANLHYEMAVFHIEKAGEYVPEQTEDLKQERKIALDICNNCIEKFKDSRGANNCAGLKESILNKELSFQAENATLPNKPFRLLVSYRNLEKLYCRAILLTDEIKKKANTYQNDDKLFDYYTSLPTAEKWNVNLPQDLDYNSHSTEIKHPALPFGEYLIMVGTNEEMSYQKQAVAYQNIWVTNLSLFIRTGYGQTQHHALNRETGNPMGEVNYKVFLQKWDYQKHQYIDVLLKEGKTNKDGLLDMPPAKQDEYGNIKIILTSGKDRYEHGDYHRQPYSENSYTQNQTFFFTDRSIYRPGQTIYFKGIVLQAEGQKNHKLLTNYPSTVTFYDVNHQKIASLDLRTNEYGSFNGKFEIPSNLLNGTMYISDSFGNTSVQVEEYKRPKFEVNFDEVKGSYRLNEQVLVSATTKAFAGNHIDGASVRYRVVRRATFPWWGWWCRWYIPPTSNEVEITNGKTTTDANGKFDITFTASPDPTIEPQKQPQYTYVVTADVTDQNGETRSGTISVLVSSVALVASVSIPDDLSRTDKTNFAVTTNNLNGAHEAANVQISVSQLEQPQRILRSRLWQKPDKFVMTEQEYIAIFPNDIYNNEDNPNNWKKGKTIANKNIDTAKDSIWQFNELKELKPGKYLLELNTKDKFGEKVEWKKIITVFDPESDELPALALLWTHLDKSTVEPNEVFNLYCGTSVKDAKVWIEIEQDKKAIRREWLSISQAVQVIAQKVAEEHRGGLAVRIGMVRLNRFLQQSYQITVPWTNKELKITTETFRSKLYPGQKEEWRLKISGSKSEKVAAEMVAALYDASLDAFRGHSWHFSIYPFYGGFGNLETDNGFSHNSSNLKAHEWNNHYWGYSTLTYETLNWFGFNMGYNNQYYHMNAMTTGGKMPMKTMSRSMRDSDGAMAPPAPAAPQAMKEMAAPAEAEEARMKKEDGAGNADKNGGGSTDQAPKADFKGVQIRKNLQETAFFMPELRTNDKGEIIIAFQIPEALTKWKLLTFGHTKNLEYGQLTQEVVTQKDLMVVPNLPRFMRENDKIVLAAKISNLTEQDIKGRAILKLLDATTMTPIDTKLGNNRALLDFSAKAKQSTSVEWTIDLPVGTQAVVCQILAQSGEHSDGEESVLPVLTNRMLVTETMPLPVRGKTTKQFTFGNMSKATQSNTLAHFSYTLEMTSNPAWYAVQALPYLMEYPYECTEQIFSRYYANSIAKHVANSSPKIKQVFDTWKREAEVASTIPGKDAAGALLSNLEKNQELKQLLLQETPWVMQAKDESERKRRVGLLFDLDRMANELTRVEKELLKRQTPSGGWTWFPGMPDDRYITQHIVCGMGHLDNLGVKTLRENSEIWQMIQRALPFLDTKMKEDYDNLLRHKADLSKDHLGYTTMHYLYARSFFRDIPIDSKCQKAFDYWMDQSQKYWLSKGTYMQAMIALAQARWENGDSKTAYDIMSSLKQNTVNSEEMGMYFKDNRGGWYWYQAPIETQALAIEAFDEVAKDQNAVNDLKVWLLKQKQTQDWKTTKATAEACYALLLRGTDWLASDELVEVVVGKHKINPKDKPDLKTEAGTGYYKLLWKPEEIDADMANISVTQKNEGVSWGAVYWQYFEQLDKIKGAETPLSIKKELFLQTDTKNGPKLSSIANGATLHVGDLVKVRVEIRVDRDMEYVHLKDMRAAGFEPINVISQYKWQGGLGYYESTKDAATNFFMHWLPKGTYVFEYPLRVSNKGDFSNGITTMQCMYAPEFSSHSEGIRVKVE